MTLAKEVLFLQLTIGVVALITVGLIVDDRAKQSKERSAPAQPVHVVEGKVIQKGDNTFVLSDEPDPSSVSENYPISDKRRFFEPI